MAYRICRIVHLPGFRRPSVLVLGKILKKRIVAAATLPTYADIEAFVQQEVFPILSCELLPS